MAAAPELDRWLVAGLEWGLPDGWGEEELEAVIDGGPVRLPEAGANVMLRDMKKQLLAGAGMGLLMACALSCAAQDGGYWRAASTNSSAITGDVDIANNKVTIDYFVYPVAPVRRLGPAEVAAAFGADVNAGQNGELYRLFVPAAKRFEHHNTLCGTDDTQWMATYVAGRTLQVAFFPGPTRRC